MARLTSTRLKTRRFVFIVKSQEVLYVIRLAGWLKHCELSL